MPEPRLVLIHRDTGQEIAQRPMRAAERYEIYHQCFAHELLAFAAHRYTIHSVSWRPRDEACVVTVTYHSYDGSCGEV